MVERYTKDHYYLLRDSFVLDTRAEMTMILDDSYELIV